MLGQGSYGHGFEPTNLGPGHHCHYLHTHTREDWFGTVPADLGLPPLLPMPVPILGLPRPGSLARLKAQWAETSGGQVLC